MIQGMTIWGGYLDEGTEGECYIPFRSDLKKTIEALIPLAVDAIREFDEISEAVARDLDPHDMRRRPGEVPTPKTAPPMWAPNPAKSKRDRQSPRRVK